MIPIGILESPTDTCTCNTLPPTTNNQDTIGVFGSDPFEDKKS